jgi:hypothetical protein
MPLAGFICTALSGTLFCIIMRAWYSLAGGAWLYGPDIGTPAPLGPTTPGTIGGPKPLP